MAPVFDKPLKIYRPTQGIGPLHRVTLPSGKIIEVVIDSDLYTYIRSTTPELTLQSIAFKMIKNGADIIFCLDCPLPIPLWRYAEVPKWMGI